MRVYSAFFYKVYSLDVAVSVVVNSALSGCGRGSCLGFLIVNLD